MLEIACPWCGPRAEIEFSCGGAAHGRYPADPHAFSDAEWAAYLWVRENPKGDHAERWCHAAGCRRWFNAVRDTVTHEIGAVYRMGDPRPENAT